MQKRTLVVLLVTGLLLVAAALGAWAEDEQLSIVQDESSMERTIERYLVNTHKLIIDEKIAANDPADLYLELPLKGDPMPKFRITIDSQPLHIDKSTGKVLERGVLLNLYTGVTIQKEDTAKALAAINDWNRRKAFASVYIDTDGEVVCSWILNVLEEGLPTEYVYDTLARVQANWRDLYPELTAVVTPSQ